MVDEVAELRAGDAIALTLAVIEELDSVDAIELVAAIGNWRMISSVLRSLEIPLEEGVVPWPPDGKVPGA